MATVERARRHAKRTTPQRTRRCVVFALLVCVGIGSVFTGAALGSETATVADRVGSVDSADLSGSVESIGSQNARWQAVSAPFAQADDEDEGEDEGTRVINITAPGEDVEYTLTAPDLEPTDDVEVGENAEGAANPETVRGDTALGTIGNGAHDTYRFTGPTDAVSLESENIDDLDVTIDGESVDPRTLTGEGTDTTTTATETTTTETTADTTDTEAATTGTASAAATADSSGAESGQSGFGIVMFVLIGVVSGLVLAGALVYVVGSDRFG